MLKQVERLGRLVTQLLDLSKLESGTVPLDSGPFELRPVIEQAARESAVNAAQTDDKKVEVSLDVVPQDLHVRGDMERVHQVLANLLDNAVRHSPEGGRVTVTAAPADGRVRIEVSDEGPGLAEADTTRVFERFYRSDSGRAASEGGSGLGLAIARWIVELHDGDIRAENRTPTGCVMTVHLPRA
jgi:signal transduction histidine kinase